MISDSYLSDLAARDPGNGTFTDTEQAALAMALPVMAAELLRHRHGPAPSEIAERANVIDMRLFMAEAVITQADNVTPAELREACTILLTHSRNPLWIDAARQVLREMEAAA